MSVDVGTFRPSSVDELSTFVREARQAGRTLRPHGGDTRAAFSNLAPVPDHEIDLRGLDGVIDYSPVDLTLAVQPGMTLAAIDALLAVQRQRLVLDAPIREQSTIGGTFAAGLSGPRRLRFGSLKDFVIGAEVVTSDGDVAKSGGMVVKNVSGYEMARLHYGAHGAFGIVTRLNLRVQPLPEKRVEVVASFAGFESCSRAAGAVLVSNLDPVAIYSVRDAGGQWALHVQLEGSAAFVAGQIDKVRQAIMAAEGTVQVDTNSVEGASTPVFDHAVDVTNAVDTVVARLSVPASKQADVIADLDRLDDAYLLADAGSGLIYVRCAAGDRALQAILDAAPATTLLALPDRLKEGRDVFGPMDPGAAEVLRRVKREFDPRSIFSSGRFALHL